MSPEVRISATTETLVEEFAHFVADFISSRPSTNIALSGGSTPKAFFDALVKNHKDSIDWASVNFYWGDERCVPPDHEESNYKMTQDHLLSHINIPADNIHRVRGEISPDKASNQYSELLKKRLPKNEVGIPKFDLVILGLGTDGHTASIFPHQDHLLTTNEICSPAEHPSSSQKRVTLTGTTINAADHVYFLTVGESKAEKVAQIINKASGFQKLPASHIKPVNGKVIWFIDQAAAKNL